MKPILPGGGDLAFVLRTLGRHPAFSAAVIGTLAVAIGANVAIFSIVNALVFRPFPYPGVERLVVVSSTPKSTIRRLGVSFPDYADWNERARSFESIGLAGGHSFVMSSGSMAGVVDGARSTASLFRVLGLPPLLGRAFSAGEDRPGGAPVVVLGQALWERRFDGDPQVLGRVLRLDGRDHVIVGVMPRDFAFPDHAELWVPMTADPLREDRGARGYTVMARLRSGVSTEAAAGELRRLAAEQARDHVSTNADVDVLVASLAGPRGPRPLAFALFIALAAGGCVLLIACSNVASLVLARVTSRAQELAIRRALGATPAQIGRLLLVEGLVLALPGGALGLLGGQAGRDALLAMVPSGIPTWMRFDIDWRVVAYTLALSVLAALGTTLSPGLRGIRGARMDGLKASATASGGTSHGVRSALVMAEVALTFVLLVGAGLMVRTFLNATNLDPGFSPAGLLTLRLPLPAADYPPARRAAFFGALTARVASVPGVADVALTSLLPLAGQARGVEYEAEGEGAVPRSTRPLAIRCVVSGGYFRVTRLPIVAGRSFDALDTAGNATVAIVSRALADSQWPHGEAIGRRLRLPGETDAPWLTVVGVAGDVNYWRLEDNALPWIYVPLAQNAPSSMTLVVSGASGVAPGAELVRAQVKAEDPDVPVLDLLPFEEVIRRSLWAERMFSRIFQVFGLVALALAVIGIYGLVAYSVAQRTREIGIRAALGADRRSLAWLVLRDGARLGLAGVAVGAAVAWPATRAMTGLLYGVTPHDGWTFAAVSLFLLAVACLASYLPARQAARMEPLHALREG